MTPDNLDPIVRAAWFRGLRPQSRLRVSQWAEKHRRLSAKSASSPGRWRNAKTPYLVEIMDRLSPTDPIEEVIFMKASQIGGTEAGNNWLGYIIHHAPGPSAIVMPTEEDAKLASEQRIETLIDETPALRGLVTEPRAKRGGSRRMLKQFPGGMIRFVWANSPAKLKSMPAGNLFLDEVDEYPADAGGQGDPVVLARARSRTFPRRKAFIPSTPTRAGGSKIASLYRRGDQRRYFVPCPHCGEYQTLEWAGIKWDKGDDGSPVSVRYECAVCAESIQHSDKAEMLRRGEWRPTAKGDPGITSYHLSSLYSPPDWYSWEKAARDFVAAHRRLKEHRDPTQMIAFVNTVLGEEWVDEEGGTEADWVAVQSRAEPYPEGEVPAGAHVLTAGVDVQHDRLEASVWGWGVGEEAWLVEHAVFCGDPVRGEVWEELDAWLMRTWPTSDGREMGLASVQVDSGDGSLTHEVYGYVRQRLRQRVIAIKGSSNPKAPVIGKPTAQDVNWAGRTIKKGVQLWPVGVHRAKVILSRRLRITEPGPGRIHTPEGLSDDWYQQLCGEKLVTRHERGAEKVQWVPVRPSQRVEVWDCFVYAYAGLQRLGLTTADSWERLASARQRAAAAKRRPAPSLEAADPGEGPSARTLPPSSQQAPRRPRVVRSAWLGR